MKGVVIYGSNYGTTKEYAEALAKDLKFDCYYYKEMKEDNINNYHYIVYGGGLYAGSILGLSKTMKKINNPEDRDITIFTVGLADPEDKENITAIRKRVKEQIPEELYDEEKIFHFRGGIDYSKLSFIHKAMMTLVYKKVKNIPVEKQSADDRGIIETFNKKIDFVDVNKLKVLEEKII